jgi:SecD/SecF fusion protein
VVKNQAEEGLTGKHLDSAGVFRDMVIGKPEISLKFNNEGAAKFAKITSENTGQFMAIILDGEIYSAPVIRQPILGGDAVISGDFTEKEAFGLANILENPLEVGVKIESIFSVDPTLGKDSIEKGIRACIIGIIAVSVFMLIYYMLGGLIANIALVLNIIVLLGVFASISATLTLPGIAGIVLTIGMAIDANVLIFERIREELAAGKSLKGSIAGGYDKVFSTIFDANLTTLIASVLLIVFGTGPIKGFGTTLTIGIAVSMFTALVVTRMILEFMQQKNMIKSLSMLNLVGNTKIDFMRWSKPAFIVSWVLIAAGLVSIGIRGSDMVSHEFKGGDQVTFTFTTQPDIEDIRSVLTTAGLETATPQFQTDLGSGDQTLVVSAEFEQGILVGEALTSAFADAGIHQESLDAKGPSIGSEIQKSAIKAALFAMLGILIYVAFRFEFSFAIGASIAVLHDVLMTIGIFAFTGRQLDATMVAAILTIIGFSINDTIVVFDRIREDLKLGAGKSFRDTINLAINQTLSRTVITSGTTLLSTLALFIFGGIVINNFAFTFLVGILTGTYSTIFIASAIVLWWHKGERPRTSSQVTMEGVAPAGV